MKAFDHLSGLKALDCADSIPKSETPKIQLSGDLQVLCPKITGILAMPVHNSIALRPDDEKAKRLLRTLRSWREP
jgi:hypothetical protein